MPAATPVKMRVAKDEQRMKPRRSRFANRVELLLLAGDGLGRTLARTRIGVGTLTAHRQTAAMAQAAIAAAVRQTLDVDADFAAQVALDHVVAVDDFADLEHLGVAELIDATIRGDLH